MSLSLDDVRRIAHLARIEVTDSDSEQVLVQLNSILELIEQMRAVDTAGIEPMSHPLGVSQRLRDDTVSESDNREANMRNAPARENGLFLVPRVIE